MLVDRECRLSICSQTLTMIKFESLTLSWSVNKILEQYHVLFMFIDKEEWVTYYSEKNSFVQIRGWKAWEAETSSHGYEFANGMMCNDIFNCFSSFECKNNQFLNFADKYTNLP